ncbi:MAG: type II toxin-antitoxin system HicA family toxin [Chloroflexota bacterium]
MSNKADKLLERMKASLNNWKYTDLERLYKGFGFEVRHGGNHDIFTHPDYPEIQQSVARHPKLSKAYVQDAIDAINKLKRFQERDKQNDE